MAEAMPWGEWLKADPKDPSVIGGTKATRKTLLEVPTLKWLNVPQRKIISQQLQAAVRFS